MHAEKTTACTEAMDACAGGSKPCKFGLSACTKETTARAEEMAACADQSGVNAVVFFLCAGFKTKHAPVVNACTDRRNVRTVRMAVRVEAASACAVTSSLLLFVSPA